ncbi:sensor histidine kinase [Ktedonospora formicarum]|uniref:histidine kinase n=1 Tax=Ktedonospora formicarum TaxID=2778364 RepID=A0A8J3I2B2_9CHLR|nr:ATP-binding protein [Ktedonospora formicarum]GHO46306.1 hypothetical protein KSX_44690 [Ktedonospora formicarum]
MSNKLALLQRIQSQRRRRANEPGTAIFQGLRLRLTLWYSGVLGIALALFGIALYFGVQQLLLSPIQQDLSSFAHRHARDWLTNSPDFACNSPLPTFGFPHPEGSVGRDEPFLLACFDQNARLQPEDGVNLLPSAFLDIGLVKQAMHDGSASDIIDSKSTLGTLYRYALVIPNTNGSNSPGVILVGKSVQTEESALSILLTLLLSIGGVALLGAFVGGLFLAQRALVPAHVAWNNQQRFIADASHELRTPLTLLRADAEVLLRSSSYTNADDRELLEDIVTEASHMTTLASNMLTLARLDAGTQHREHEIVSLEEIARAGARRVTALAQQKKITLELETPHPIYILGDPLLIEQALLILLDNAIKYNLTGGKVIIQTSVQKQQALLGIRDTGIGIAANHLPYLGARFYRVDKARSRAAGGTGLGLSIARAIAIEHGGSLNLSSAAGRGTTAIISLPLIEGVPTRPAQEPAILTQESEPLKH